ncbi:hypothetical protein K7W42_07380 [Deinococcus sp. HMF7604]|uniref:hypothetical protein n=1 Tax=Deinococcus betulae TaxID=2873312 RepID=UPI001CCF1493|nr:hypothetical protein [Deinococcus betulae]MBZ9750682.1 hypothetical protein [Deinococcus betulae]
MKPEARTYLQEALALIQQEALFADRVDWPAVTHACEVLAAGAVEPAETYPALRHALAALTDRHSFLRLPQADTV